MRLLWEKVKNAGGKKHIPLGSRLGSGGPVVSWPTLTGVSDHPRRNLDLADSLMTQSENFDRAAPIGESESYLNICSEF